MLNNTKNDGYFHIASNNIMSLVLALPFNETPLKDVKYRENKPDFDTPFEYEIGHFEDTPSLEYNVSYCRRFTSVDAVAFCLGSRSSCMFGHFVDVLDCEDNDTPFEFEIDHLEDTPNLEKHCGNKPDNALKSTLHRNDTPLESETGHVEDFDDSLLKVQQLHF